MDSRELEQQLMAAVLAEHERHPHPGVEGARMKLHLSLHVVAETQIRRRNPPVVAETLERLMREGLDRHEAIHAIGTVIAEEVMQVVGGKQRYDEIVYAEKLRELSAAAWRTHQQPPG